jgi:hypothetical protein
MMGPVSVYGVVLCDCWETGPAVAPVPVVRDGVWLRAAPGFDARAGEVQAWARTACAHPDGWLVERQVLRMAMLNAMAEYGGAVAFPVVHSVLPTANGGSVAPADSARCLAEIDRLGALMSQRSMVVIVGVDDDTVVFVDPVSSLVATPRHHVPGPAIFGFDERGALHGLTGLAGRPMTSTWLGDDAVVRVSDADGRVLFAARDFVQERDGEDWTFRDERTGAVVRHCSPVTLGAGSTGNEPYRMRAEIRPIDIDHYLSGVGGLRELFEASVRTGRPVHWF